MRRNPDMLPGKAPARTRCGHRFILTDPTEEAHLGVAPRRLSCNKSDRRVLAASLSILHHNAPVTGKFGATKAPRQEVQASYASSRKAIPRPWSIGAFSHATYNADSVALALLC